MNYSRTKAITNQDQSRAAIGSIIQPLLSKFESRPHLGVMLPPLPSIPSSCQSQAENEKELQAIRIALLLLMKRSRLCLESTTKTRNEFLRGLGQNSIGAISALMFEKSFINLNQTSIDYLLEKLLLHPFLAQFYRSLEPDSHVNKSLDDETASLTLQTLVGCCIKDFGFDRILYPLGEAFYRSILLEYPLVLNSSKPFLRTEVENSQQTPDPEISQSGNFSLTNLAAVATELRSHARASSELDSDKKLVVLRFCPPLLSSHIRPRTQRHPVLWRSWRTPHKHSSSMVTKSMGFAIPKLVLISVQTLTSRISLARKTTLSSRFSPRESIAFQRMRWLIQSRCQGTLTTRQG